MFNQLVLVGQRIPFNILPEMSIVTQENTSR